MPVTDVTTDIDARTLTMTAEFAAPVDRVWDVYADARKLEQVWGPPGYPSTFVDHELKAGTRSTYYMTSPEGDKFGGYWNITSVDEGKAFELHDGFALDTDTFEPNTEMPESDSVYAFEATDTGTKAVYTTVYGSAEALQKVLDMGMIEGATAAIAQIDDLLA